MPRGTQLGTQWCLFRSITPGSIPRNIQESVVAKPLSGAPFPILKPAECLRFSCRFYGGYTFGDTMGKPAPYLFQKRGIYYLQKRVPQQLVPRLGRVIIRKSLRTTCRATAIKTAGPILKALDREWHEALFTISDGVGIMDFLTKPCMSEPTLREATAA